MIVLREEDLIACRHEAVNGRFELHEMFQQLVDLCDHQVGMLDVVSVAVKTAHTPIGQHANHDENEENHRKPGEDLHADRWLELELPTRY